MKSKTAFIGDCIAQRKHSCFLTKHPRVRIPAFPKKFIGKIIDVAEANLWRWLEDSGQWLENVDRTHLVLASGKPL